MPLSSMISMIVLRPSKRRSRASCISGAGSGRSANSRRSIVSVWSSGGRPSSSRTHSSTRRMPSISKACVLSLIVEARVSGRNSTSKLPSLIPSRR